MKRQELFSNIYMIAWGVLWWLLIHSAGSQLEILTYVLMLGIFGFYLFANNFSKPSLYIILLSVLCGSVIDGSLMHFEVIAYNSFLNIELMPPPWIFCLWVLLGIGVYTYPNMFGKHPLLTASVCFVSAPLCYWTGHRAEAINLPDQMTITLGAIALVYAISGLVLYNCRKRVAHYA